MFINEDDKNKIVIGKEHENNSVWFTTKEVLQKIKINNMDKNDILYVGKVSTGK